MSLTHITRFSAVLQEHLKISVILPDNLSNKPLPTIWLLHGLGENGSCWYRFATIENLATQYQVAVIMPNVYRSFYMDETNGLPYWTYLTEDSCLNYAMLPLSTLRKQNFVIGNSMGGFGALKFGLNILNGSVPLQLLSPAVNLRDISNHVRYISCFRAKITENYLENLALTAPNDNLKNIVVSVNW